jgi:hypothetical protein
MDHESAGVRAGEADGGSDDTVIDLHLTDAACAAGAGLAAAGGVAALSRVGAADGLPFLLGADGSYDLQLNRFFRELDSWGCGRRTAFWRMRGTLCCSAGSWRSPGAGS